MSVGEHFSSAIERIGKTRDASIAWIARVVSERPKRSLFAGLLLLFALASGGNRVQQIMGYYIWHEPGDPQIATLDRFEQQFGSDLTIALVVHSPSGVFDKDSAQLLIELTDQMWKVPEVTRVDSLSNFSWIHATGDDLTVEDLLPHDRELTPELLAERKKVALNHELLPGFLVSKDGRTSVIYGWLRPTKTDKAENEYNDFTATVAGLKKIVSDHKGRGDHVFHIVGFPVSEDYLKMEPPKEIQKITPLIVLACILMMFVFFRRPAGALLPIAVVVPSVIATMGFMGWAGIAINPMTITTPSMIVIIAVSSTDNILHSYFRALDTGAARREATRYALEECLWPTLFANLTVSIGFLSLIFMGSPPFAQLGVAVGVMTVVVWMLVCLILAPLMVILPIKPKRKKVAAAKAAKDGLEELALPHPRFVRLADWMDRYKVVIVAGWVAVCGLSVWLAYQNKVQLDPRLWYDESTDVRQGMDFMRENMGPTESFEVLIYSGKEDGIKDPAFLRKVDQLQHWINEHDKVVRAYSLLDILKETNRALFGGDPAQYRLPDTRRGVADEYLVYTLQLPMGRSLNERVTLTNDALRLTVLSKFQVSPAVVQMDQEIRAKALELGLNVEITGRQLLYQRINELAVPYFFRSLLTGTVVIGLILFVLFRSLRLGILSLVTNLVPILIGLGIIITLIGNSFDMTTLSTFVIILGVSLDDSIHFLEGFHRLRQKGLSTKESLARVWTGIGVPMLSSAVILAVGYLLFVTIKFPVASDQGKLIASVLLVNFLADWLLAPALLLLWKDRPAHKA